MSDMKWFEVFESYFGAKLTQREIEVWETELKKRGANNAELCSVLRHISSLGYIPRADKDRKTSKYDLRDVNLWITLYRESKGNESLHADCDLCNTTGMIYGMAKRKKTALLHKVCVPCLCSKGEQLRHIHAQQAKGPDKDEYDYLKRMAHGFVRQMGEKAGERNQ